MDDGLDLQVSKRSATLRVLVEDKIRQAISSGRFRPGQRLVERELCELIGVGRTSIREALRQLEAEGLITTHPHRGPSVSSISLDEAKQLYTVRALLEGFSGEEFARHGTDEEVGRLETAAADFVAAASAFEADQGPRTRADLIEAKTRFYKCLMEGSHNIFVQQILTLLHNRITLLRATSMTQPGRLTHSSEEIRAIVAAIKARDVEQAGDLCRHHIQMAAQIAIAYLESSEPEPVL